MTEQLVLLDEAVAPIARRTDPETSKIAAVTMREGAAHHRALIAAVLADGVARTYVEIGEACGLNPIAVARRMVELLRLGQVVRLPATRRTPSGRAAHLWRAA